MAEAVGVSSIIQNSPGCGKAVLRIKRKRSADPADILLVSHAFKKAFTDEDRKRSFDENNAVQRVFRLAGTVLKKADDKTLSQEILTKLSSSDRHKSKVKVNPRNELTVDSIHEKLRETKKLSRQTSRYKVVSEHRNDAEDDKNKDEIDAGTQEMMKFYQLYDLVLDEAESRDVADEKEGKKREKEDMDPNAILCNSVKMIREKLKIDEGPKNNLDILEKDYVYDVYCAEDNYGALSEVLDIVHLNESQLVTEASDEELGLYDDEDDSNDENNWRNDYPDEDEWNGSSDEEPRYRNDDFDYGYDERKMFSKELSSDEDFDFYGGGENDYNYEIVDEEDY